MRRKVANSLIVVVEYKVGSDTFTAEDRRQAEEYALDLHDFHAESSKRRILPVLWSTDAEPYSGAVCPIRTPPAESVDIVMPVGAEGLHDYLSGLPVIAEEENLIGQTWDYSAYRPVPNVIEAATSIFAGHDVRSIANADADNLRSTATRLVELIQKARDQGKRFLLILTGVLGSGKTLAGLHVVHSAIALVLLCYKLQSLNDLAG